MSCLPQSGGCERPFTDVFVAHLNLTEGTRYVHSACLDVLDSTVPQPEALYLDAESGHQLVVERKSISWPIDYPYRHSNDHVVGDIFSRELGDLTIDDLYEIRLPMLIEGKRASVEAFAHQAAEQIRASWPIVSTGSGLKGRAGDKWWWRFHKVPEDEREDSAPATGLTIALEGQALSLFDFLDPADLPDVLSAAIKKIFTNCSGKFASYQGIRRILLLDPHEDLQTKSADWWHNVWANLPPPQQIGEIWSGVFDGIDEEGKDWAFQRLHPTPSI